MSEKQAALVQCCGSQCKGLGPKPRSEFYSDKKSENGLLRVCKVCHRFSVEKYQQSAKGRLAKRRRKVLLEKAKEVLRSGKLGQFYPCEFVDGNCDGAAAAHFPDVEKPEEFVWLCSHHRELIARLKVPPSYERLALLVDRWS